MDLEEKQRREKLVREDWEQECSDVKKLLETESGRRFYWTLLSVTRIFQPCYTGTVDTYHNEGAREKVGLRYWKLLFDAAPEQFIPMQRESKIRDESRKSVLASFRAQESDGDPVEI